MLNFIHHENNGISIYDNLLSFAEKFFLLVIKWEEK